VTHTPSAPCILTYLLDPHRTWKTRAYLFEIQNNPDTYLSKTTYSRDECTDLFCKRALPKQDSFRKFPANSLQIPCKFFTRLWPHAAAGTARISKSRVHGCGALAAIVLLECLAAIACTFCGLRNSQCDRSMTMCVCVCVCVYVYECASRSGCSAEIFDLQKRLFHTYIHACMHEHIYIYTYMHENTRIRTHTCIIFCDVLGRSVVVDGLGCSTW